MNFGLITLTRRVDFQISLIIPVTGSVILIEQNIIKIDGF